MPVKVKEIIQVGRSLIRSPKFSVTVILLFGLGIGSAAAMLSVLRAVVLRPLPVEDQDSVLVLSMHDQRDLAANLGVQYAEMQTLRETTEAFTDIAAVGNAGTTPFVIQDGVRVLFDVPGVFVSGSLFDVLRVVPVVGRPLTANDDLPSAPDVIVISEAIWRRDFGNDPEAIGRPLTIVGQSYTLVGVMPDGLGFPAGAEMWATRNAFGGIWPAPTNRGRVDLVARLGTGVPIERGRTELENIVRQASGPLAGNRTIVARPILDEIVGDTRYSITLLSGAVGLLFLIACGNVTTLLLTRASQRSSEMGVRAALGGRIVDLVRYATIEMIILAVAGSLLGLIIGAGLVQVLVRLAPPEFPRFDELSVDLDVLLFSLIAGGVATIVAGLGSVMSAVRSKPLPLLKAYSSGDSRGGKTTHGRQMIVAGQLALALVVLTSVGLLARSLVNIQSVDPGFDHQHLLVRFRPNDLDDIGVTFGEYLGVLQTLRERLQGIPGVEAVTAVTIPPYSTGGRSPVLRPVVPAQLREADVEDDNVTADVHPVMEHHFSVFGIQLQRGRVILDTDAENAPRVAVVNETLARLLSREETAIGQLVRVGGSGPWRVVGVVQDTRFHDVRENPTPTIYLPYRQGSPGVPPFLAIRTSVPPSALLLDVRQIVEVATPFGLQWIRTPDDQLRVQLVAPRFVAFVMSVLSVLAVVLVASGVFGSLSLSVAQRTRELAIRVALGATASNLQRLVFWQAAMPAFLGLGVGALLAFWTGQLFESLLFGVDAADVPAMGISVAFLLSLVAVANWVSVYKVTRHKAPQQTLHPR